VDKVSRSGASLGRLVLTRIVGFSLVGSLNFIFDRLIYPVVVGYAVYVLGFFLGGLAGLVIMGSFSVMICSALLIGYNWSKTDWLAIEATKRGIEQGGWIHRPWIRLTRRLALARFLQMLYKKLTAKVDADRLMLVMLSIKLDPFLVTTILRKESYGNLTEKDLRNFWLSALISNGWWTLQCMVTAEALFALFEYLPTKWQEGIIKQVHYAQAVVHSLLN